MRKQQKAPILKNGKRIRIKRLEELGNIDIAKFDANTELWENGKLGASAKHAKPVSDKEEKALDDALGLQLISFRIQKSLIQQLKRLAKLEGMGYQTFMRQILTRYVRAEEHESNQVKVGRSNKYRKAG